MTHRERVLTTLAHREPDRAPRSLGLVGAALDQFRQRTGAHDPAAYWDLDLTGWVGFQRPHVDWAARFGRYYAGTGEPPEFEHAEYPPEWGVARRSAHFHHFSAPRFPLQRATTVREIEAFPYPDYVGEWGHAHLDAEVARLKAAGHPVIGWGQRLFQNAWYLRSREQLFLDAVDQPALVEALFTRIEQVLTPLAERFAAAGVDILSVADDIGMQDRMMISPAWWRRWVKPHWRAVFAAARRVKPDLQIWYHTDGCFAPVIPDLLELGVTMLNTVQPECMDVYAIKREWGRELSLGGTMGVQSVLRWGTPTQVQAEVRRQLAALGAGGGFVLSPANAIEPDVPWDNLVAFIAAADGK